MKKIGIRIAPATAILLICAVALDRTGVSLLTVAAALLHECGHLTAARLLRIRPNEMRLDVLGARLEITGRVLSYGEEWLLAAAGPIASLVGAAVAAPFWSVTPHASVFSCASLVLGVLNLLPIRTFDGGRMLECFCAATMGVRGAQRVLSASSFLFLLLLWIAAVYFLLKAADGLSLFCFSLSLFLRFFDGEKT